MSGGGAEPHLKCKTPRCGFTLAEVLITLGIIGVVVAMTMPVLIQKHRSYVLHKQFLKSYSNLCQTVLFMKNDLGIENFRDEFAVFNAEKLEYTNADYFYKEFDKYLKIVEKVPNYDIKSYDNSHIDKSRVLSRQALYLLPDGSSIGRSVEDTRIYFYIDVNSPQKGPNRLGFDIFIFWIVNKNDVVEPVKMSRLYTEMDPDNGIHSYAGFPCSIKSKLEFNGFGCAWFALNNINPDDETKKYWDSLPW